MAPWCKWLDHGCARVAHCFTASWRNFSHYCRPLRHYDVWLRVLITEKHWQHAVYRNKGLELATEQLGKLRYVTAVDGRLKRFPWVEWFAHPWVRRSSPTAGVSSSLLSHSIWVSWWTEPGLDRFFLGFSRFPLTIRFIPQFLHTHLIHFITLVPVVVQQAQSVGILAIYRPLFIGVSSHLIPRPGPMSDARWEFLW